MDKVLFRRGNRRFFQGKINTITQTIIIIILISIFLPIFMEFFIWRNDFPSAIDNSDWSSFFGSYLGGIIGGFATLLAVRFTLLETKKEYYKDFLIQMIDISATYLHDIKKYKAGLKSGKRLCREIIDLQHDVEVMQKDLNTHSAPNISGIEEKLSKELQEKKNEIEKKQNRQNEMIKILQDIENNIQHNFIILDINLRDLPVGSDFLAKAKQVSASLAVSVDHLQEYNNYDKYMEQLYEEEILLETNKFVENYKQKYLF